MNTSYFRKRSLFLLVMLYFAGCSAVTTRIEPTAEKRDGDGLVYRLPLKAITVSLVVKGSDRKVSVGTTDAYPDMDHKFVAQYLRNQVGHNVLSIKIDASGLLDGDSSSTVTPQIKETVDALAGALGTWKGASNAAPEVGEKDQSMSMCSVDGTYAWVIEPPGTDNNSQAKYQKAVADLKSCNISWNFSGPGINANHDSTIPQSQPHLADGNVSGLFYRQQIAYTLEVSDTAPGATTPPQTSLLLIPTRYSPIEFLPAHRSLFATSKLTVTFAHGIPTAYGEDIDSEWLGAVTLPAEIFKAYFAAIGAVFQERQTANDDQAKYLDGVSSLAIAQAKMTACLSALKSKNDDQIKATCPAQ